MPLTRWEPFVAFRVYADLDLLHSRLHEMCKEMTRWDVYEAEVQSGHLQWSLIHSEKFFRENAKRMEGSDGNFGILKVRQALAAVVNQSKHHGCSKPSLTASLCRNSFALLWGTMKMWQQLHSMILGSL